ncbi:hypothetical protein [Calothrix sp. NIES-3974]|uniref:hypothetical protein n=1 Tax=Calothrix sp. NIES-3974 TaxID=2005462 RepID=UPI000B60CF12|nr:hypothetical protein [Calothrix sp. NIES-3974]BAZ06992.1 hypothetical protein NIES3974_36540 [Calothrix sp. NIES-3974]
MSLSISDSTVKAAINAIESESATIEEKIAMLIELAQGFECKSKTTRDLRHAVSLYYQAYELCQDDYPLLKARTQVGIGNTLKAISSEGSELLVQAKTAYEDALPILQELGTEEEVASVQMNLGLVLQSLVTYNLARITDAIAAYRAALKFFTWQTHPHEYAVLNNNIAIAYLSMPLPPVKERMREALAIQYLELALQHINCQEHPHEYAMLQNNLGNALQYLPNSQPIENNLRAISAYDEALKVRTYENTPIEYAKTICNKANALLNLPDNLNHPHLGNPQNQSQAQTYYLQALDIFQKHQQLEQVKVVQQALQSFS